MPHPHPQQRRDGPNVARPVSAIQSGPVDAQKGAPDTLTSDVDTDVRHSVEPAIGGDVECDTSGWPGDYSHVWLNVTPYHGDITARVVLEPAEAREIADDLRRCADHCERQRIAQTPTGHPPERAPKETP